MRYQRLGRSGLRLSRIGLGMMSYGSRAWREWVLTEDEAEPVVRHAVEAGVTFFDTADRYSHGQSEVVTGRLLAKFFPRRDDYVLGTKVYNPMGSGPNDAGLSRKHIMSAVDASLRRLGTDYIDLYQIHRWDADTPIDETLRALHDLITAGKVRYVGASSMYAWQFGKAQYIADQLGATRFVAMQNHYNVVYREEEREMIPLCLDLGVGLLPWSPLGRGFITGSRGPADEARSVRGGSDPLRARLYGRPADFAVRDAVAEVAAVRGVPAAQIALAWLLGRPGVVAPVIGARTQRHIDDAVAALDVDLGPDEQRQLEERYEVSPVLGH